MRIIAVANQKGGCGKTTVALNLSACLAREGQRTLLLDLDPQGHCGLGLAVPEEQIEHTIADVLLDPDSAAGLNLTRITWQISNNFDLAPSKTDLASLEQRLAGIERREFRLRAALETVADRYDFALIDSPPTIGFLTLSALVAADEVIIPVDTGYFALHGLSKQLETLRSISPLTGRPLALRILGNLYDVRTKLAREILAELRKRHPQDMLNTFINFNTKLKESTSFGQPITEYDPASIGCRDFVKLARELIALSGTTQTIPQSIIEQADAIAADAEKLLATSQVLIGLHREPAPVRTPARAPSVDDAHAADVSTAAATVGVEAATPAVTPDETPRAAARAETRQGELDAATQRKIERIYGPQPTDDGVVFLTRAPGARSVRIAGDFNGWNGEVTPLRPVDSDGTFQVRLPLGPGRYHYRYVIDGRWVNDPHNHLVDWNPFGELNNVVVVGA